MCSLDLRLTRVSSPPTPPPTRTEGEKPHKCELCDFTCRDVSYLSKHMLTHSNTKDYMCTECGYVTKWKHYLSVHMRKHAGDLRYERARPRPSPGRGRSASLLLSSACSPGPSATPPSGPLCSSRLRSGARSPVCTGRALWAQRREYRPRVQA